MRLHALRVEHFGCIDQAKVEFGAGLNVLYGPNDLGKSTLALAVRAALLLPTGSSAQSEFVQWSGDNKPVVTLEVVANDARYYRITKRFVRGGGGAQLEESNDGVTYRQVATGREVDGQLRELLGWGAGKVGGRGGTKGMPAPFLRNVLLAEQRDPQKVFGASLATDGDDSALRRLRDALGAMAQDPAFKRALDQAQAKHDVAFSSTGLKRRGRLSPWLAASDRAKRASDKQNGLRDEVDKQRALTESIEVLAAAVATGRGAVAHAEEHVTQVHRDVASASARTEALAILEAKKQELLRIDERLAELAQAESAADELAGRSADAQTELDAATLAIDARKTALEAARDGLRQATNDSGEQERALEKERLLKKRLELEGQRDEAARVVECVEAAIAADEELAQSRGALAELVAHAAELNASVEKAKEEAQQADERHQLMQGVRVYCQWRDHTRRHEEAQKSNHDAAQLRADATTKREQAKAELAQHASDELPSIGELQALKELAKDIEVAEAKAGVGLALELEVLPAYASQLAEATAMADAKSQELKAGQQTLEARATIELDLPGVAKLAIRAGESKARGRLENLQHRWTNEAKSWLHRSGAEDVAELGLRVTSAYEASARAAELDASAERLEELATASDKSAAAGPELRAEAARLAEELAGWDRARVEAETDEQRLHVGEPLEAALRGAEQRRIAARDALMEANQGAGQHQSKLAAAEQRVAGHQAAADKASQRLEPLAAEPPEAPRPRPEQLSLADGSTFHERRDAAHGDERRAAADLADVEERLAALEGEQSTVIHQAEAELLAAEAAHQRARKDAEATAAARDGARTAEAEHTGRLNELRSAQSKLDRPAAEAQVTAAAAHLDALPKPGRSVTEADVEAARSELREREGQYAQAHDDYKKASGALEQIGGSVLLENLERAKEATQQARLAEQELDLEYESWRLLLETLRASENEEAGNLGAALIAPVSEQFHKLTAGRYGPIELGPRLETTGIAAAGDVRATAALSLGTQEQLATLLRLSIAQELGDALVLDDHLAQTDPARLGWFGKVLRAAASDIQIVVLTCRPGDYIGDADRPAEGQVVADHAAGLVRVVNLAGIVERSEG